MSETVLPPSGTEMVERVAKALGTCAAGDPATCVLRPTKRCVCVNMALAAMEALLGEGEKLAACEPVQIHLENNPGDADPEVIWRLMLTRAMGR